MTLEPQPFLRRLQAYTPGEQPLEADVIKLNTNEFPYPPAPEVIEAIRREAGSLLRRYPSPRCTTLRERLAERHRVRPEQIFVGNGSDEVLRLLIHAYGGPGRTVASLDPSYSLYATLVEIVNGNYQAYKLDNMTEWPADLGAEGWDVFLLCVPNPPIGIIYPLDKIKSLAHGPGLVVLDEAYIEFADTIPEEYSSFEAANVVRTRTFSKAFALAGLRVGYAVGPVEVIDQLGRIADSYNVNRISQAAAVAALDAEAYYAARLDEMRIHRGWLSSQLAGRHFDVRPSQGNFVFALHPRARELYEGLKRKGILVRHFNRPPLDGGLRISIGTGDELHRLVDALDELL